VFDEFIHESVVHFETDHEDGVVTGVIGKASPIKPAATNSQPMTVIESGRFLIRESSSSRVLRSPISIC
jgi:hypothetical protein